MDVAQGVVLNGMRSMTLNGSVSSWPQCLSCALSDRAFGYTSENRSSECAQCFETWCWNGQDNSAAPSGEYEPTVGSVPSFLTQQNLTTAENTTATNAIEPSQSPGAAFKTSSAQSGVLGGLLAGVGAMVIGGLLII